MKYLSFLVAFCIVLFSIPAQASEATLPDDTKSLIQVYASSYKVDPEVITKVVQCESSFNENAVGDHGNSYGLVQIFLKYHPGVTKEQALDNNFAIDFLAKNLSEGNGKLWSCYRKIYMR